MILKFNIDAQEILRRCTDSEEKYIKGAFGTRFKHPGSAIFDRFMDNIISSYLWVPTTGLGHWNRTMLYFVGKYAGRKTKVSVITKARVKLIDFCKWILGRR